jgi:hypothetical protein
MLIIELFGGLVGLLVLGRYLVNKVDTDSALRDAEAYIRNQTALYRHYSIKATQDILRGKVGSQGHIATISDSQVIEIVSRVRHERGMGPIAYHHLPDYVDKE